MYVYMYLNQDDVYLRKITYTICENKFLKFSYRIYK